MNLATAFEGALREIPGPPDDLAVTIRGSHVAAFENNRRVGYIHHEMVGRDEVIIHHMWTHMEHRGRGIARLLMDSLAERYPDETCFRTAEFSFDGQRFAEAYEASTGIRIEDDSQAWA